MGLVSNFIGFVAGRRVRAFREVAGIVPYIRLGVELDHESNGRIVVRVPVAQARMNRFLRSAAGRSELFKSIELDDTGSQLIAAIDGKITLRGLRDRLVREHSLTRLQAEASLRDFCQMLEDRGVLAYRGPKR